MYGERLRELRASTGLSQDELAKILCLSRESYGKYERGDRNPSIDALLGLAAYHDVSVDYILGRTDFPAAFGSLNPAKQKAISSFVSCSDLAAKVVDGVLHLDHIKVTKDDKPRNQRK